MLSFCFKLLQQREKRLLVKSKYRKLKMKFRKKVFFLIVILLMCLCVKAQNTGSTPSIAPPSLGQLPSCSPGAKFYSKDSVIITTFGASTVHGMYGYDFQGPLQKDFEHCYKGKVVDITNQGIPGETTTVALPRFPAAIAGRKGFILILIGLNDAIAMANNKMKLTETEKNMNYYIKTSLANNLIPIIGTLQFIDDRTIPINKTINLYVKQINTLYKRLASDNSIKIADINKAIGRDFTLYNEDGIHPNQAGYNLIGYVWFDELNQVIENSLLLIGLNQNYPNPVKTATTIGFSLSKPGRVQIKLYDITGAMVKDIYNEYQNSGYHEVRVGLNDLSPGIYIYSMQVGGQYISKKMLVVG